MIRKSLLVFLLATVASLAALAQPKVSTAKCIINQELQQPPEIVATKGVLETALHVVMVPQVPVQVWNKDSAGNWVCAPQSFNLREYSFKDDKGSVITGFPGPTLRLRKASSPNGIGEALKVTLFNDLPWSSDDECNQPCDPKNTQCTSPTINDSLPNCFHGNNTTNLHFHGLHASPQPPQDYVLLSLEPRLPVGTTTPPAASAHAHEGIVAFDSYPYGVDPLRWTQPEGTHWYHPHKHGATALQVGNGMAGALIVEGPFDDWLRGWYADKYKKDGLTLTEKVMVVQQIHDLNFIAATSILTPLPLINGQAQPVVKMRPGEVQRWRLVAATMEASAQLELNFGSLSANGTRQIAMDGVRFSPNNYDAQPLLHPGVIGTQDTFRISPGNRADFLVRAPSTAGRFLITYGVFGRVGDQSLTTRRNDPRLKGRLKGNNLPQREDVPDFLKAVKATGGQPLLLIVEVGECGASCPVMDFPTVEEWPELPDYLRNIGPVDAKHKQNVQFQLLKTLSPPTPGGVAAQPQKFAIQVNNAPSKQYTSSCVDFSEPLHSAEEWTLSQNVDGFPTTSPFHVFHIHTNAFQIVSPLPQQRPGHRAPDPIWEDSVTLPNVGQSVVIRQKFEEFTGQFVLHCHFLGHEDRGMMLGVQTVCANGKFGHATPGGEECREGNYFDAMPLCTQLKAPSPKKTTKAKKKVAALR